MSTLGLQNIKSNMNPNQVNIDFWTQQHQQTQTKIDFLTLQYHILLGESLMSTHNVPFRSEPKAELLHDDIWKLLNGFLNFYETKATPNCSIILTARGIQANLLYRVFIDFAHEMNFVNKTADKNWFFAQFNIFFKKYPKVMIKKRTSNIKYIFHDFKALKVLLQEKVCLYDPTIHISNIKKDIWDKPFDE